MSKSFRAWNINNPLLLRRDAQPTIQVRDLEWGMRIGTFVESPAGSGRKVGANRRRRMIQLATAAGIVLAIGAFSLHQYTVWVDNSLGPQLQAWTPAGLGTPQREVDASWQLSHSTQERLARSEADAQLGPVITQTKLAPASSPSPSADLVRVSGSAFDPPLTAVPREKPGEPLREWVTTITFANWLTTITYAKSSQVQPQRDRTAGKHLDWQVSTSRQMGPPDVGQR
jgi:hypothetical protein